jgi:hypothetical protein
MDGQIIKIKNEMKEYFSDYPQTYIMRLLDNLIQQSIFWRCYSYSGWNILKTANIKNEMKIMIIKDVDYIRNKLILIRYCYENDIPVDILIGIRTSLF